MKIKLALLMVAGALAGAAMPKVATAQAGGTPNTGVRPGGVGQAIGNLGQTDAYNSINKMAINGALRPDIDTPDGFRTYSRMMVVGRCLSGIGRGSVTGALDQPLNSPAERSQIAILQQRMASCAVPGLPGFLSLTRGTMSEGLYHRLVDKDPKSTGPLTAAQITGFTEAQQARFTSLDANDRGLAMVVDCVVVRDPAAARRVLASGHGTGEEATAMDALFASSPDCSSARRPAGISRPFLRAFIANSAYRVVRWQAERDKS